MMREPKVILNSHGAGKRFLAAISYFSVLFLVPMFVARKDEFARFHVRQGLVLFAAKTVLSFLFLIPVVGIFVAVALGFVSAFAFVQALSGREWPLPFLGKYAKDLEI